MNIDGNILDIIERKRLMYGHLQRMHENQWPMRIFKYLQGNWSPRMPVRTWLKEMEDATNARGTKDIVRGCD